MEWAICATLAGRFSRTLKQGMQGADVALLESKLAQVLGEPERRVSNLIRICRVKSSYSNVGKICMLMVSQEDKPYAALSY